jgi:glycosyltransferase involved in cell wall biosynthesis
MLVVTVLPRDPRVERAARAVAAAGYPVTLLCPSWGPEAGRVDWGSGIATRLLPRTLAYHTYPFLYDRVMVDAAVEEKPWLIHAHDLTTSVMGLLAADRTGAHLVADFHEWYSENVTYSYLRREFVPHPRSKRALFRRAERAVLAHASRVITVSESLAREIERAFQPAHSLAVVRNVPPWRPRGAPSVSLRTLVEAKETDFIVLYQGGLGPSRALEPIVAALAHTPPDVQLVIRGPGVERWGPSYRRLAARKGVGSRLHILPPVASDRVVEEAAGADAGIWSLKDCCLNFRFALPNKLFEYLAAGLPVLVADLPEARAVVEKYDVGLWFDPDSARSIGDGMTRMAMDRDFAARCRANTRTALSDLCAEREWAQIPALYEELDVER